MGVKARHPRHIGGGRVEWAQRGGVILRQAVLAAGDYFSPAREGLAVEAGVRGGPVEVFSCQHIAAELAVVGHPIGPFVIVGRT